MRLWPVPGATRRSLEKYMLEKLGLSESFVKEDMGSVTIRKHVERKPRYQDEVFATFETKQIRDLIKLHAPNLAKFGQEAGMRLHVPDTLQKDFKALMGLSYELKRTHKDLNRSIKFDEDNLGLFMDMQLRKDGPWKRVDSEQAKQANGRKSTGPDSFATAELVSLLSETQDIDSE